MEEREPTIKILYENTEKPINQMWLTFPLSGRERAEQKMLALTKGHEKESSISFRIARVESPIPNLGQYLPADGWFQEISRLAEKIEGMDREEQMKFSGIECEEECRLCVDFGAASRNRIRTEQELKGIQAADQSQPVEQACPRMWMT